ncbi:hypothetical protein [Rhizobium leguminosarum]
METSRNHGSWKAKSSNMSEEVLEHLNAMTALLVTARSMPPAENMDMSSAHGSYVGAGDLYGDADPADSRTMRTSPRRKRRKVDDLHFFQRRTAADQGHQGYPACLHKYFPVTSRTY